MIFLYRLVLYVCLPLVVIRLVFRATRSKRYFQHIPQRFGFNLGLDRSRVKDGIWIHAVSVGEVNAAIPLIKSLKDTYPDLPLTVTTMTPTGSDRVTKALGDMVYHCYLPYDFPGSVNRFLDLVSPRLAMVMETEIWPNFILGCHQRNVPMIYTNVRLSERSHKGYKRFQGLFEPILRKVEKFAVQSDPDAARLIDLGALQSSVEVTGSIKFEFDIPASILEASQSVRRDLGWDRPVWVVGSTHENEEIQILEAFEKAKSSQGDLLLVIAPRHPERFNSVYRLCTRQGFATELRSESPHNVSENTEIYLVDTMGELMMMIAASDFAFIGGSLVPTGGHNVLEACGVGKAVIFGPHMFNFQEISNMVIARGAGVQVMDSEELAEVVVKMIQDPVLRDQYGTEGKKFVEENKGALNTISAMVRECLAAG